MKTGLFLPTLVSLGPYAAGAVQALLQDGGLTFDVIGASSGGVITGAFAATGQIDQLVEIWRSWENRDIMAVDWRALLRGGIFWAPSLMTNEPEHRTGLDPYISDAKLLPGVRFRFHVSNLSAGTEEILEYPGAEMPLLTAVHTAVAVPVLFPTVTYQGVQLADGAILNGCPLAQLMLDTDIERLYVVGVAPQLPVYKPGRNAPDILRAALEWNQYSETTAAITQARAQNTLSHTWQSDRQAITQIIRECLADEALQVELLCQVERIYGESCFPWQRPPIEMIPILPSEQLDGLFGDFQPARSRALLNQGREDALRTLHNHQS